MSETKEALPHLSRQALVRRQVAARRVPESKSYDFWKLTAKQCFLAKRWIPSGPLPFLSRASLSLSGFNGWELEALTLGRHEEESFLGRCLASNGICR